VQADRRSDLDAQPRIETRLNDRSNPIDLLRDDEQFQSDLAIRYDQKTGIRRKLRSPSRQTVVHYHRVGGVRGAGGGEEQEESYYEQSRMKEWRKKEKKATREPEKKEPRAFSVGWGSGGGRAYRFSSSFSSLLRNGTAAIAGSVEARLTPFENSRLRNRTRSC
jgi:hypothetical protein